MVFPHLKSAKNWRFPRSESHLFAMKKIKSLVVCCVFVGDEILPNYICGDYFINHEIIMFNFEGYPRCSMGTGIFTDIYHTFPTIHVSIGKNFQSPFGRISSYISFQPSSGSALMGLLFSNLKASPSGVKRYLSTAEVSTADAAVRPGQVKRKWG